MWVINNENMPGRLMVGQLILDQFIGVQIPAGQHLISL